MRMFSFVIHSFIQSMGDTTYVQLMGENLVPSNGDFMFSSIERMRLSCVLTNLSFLNKILVHLPNSQWRLSITIFVQQFFIFLNLRKLDHHPFFWCEISIIVKNLLQIQWFFEFFFEKSFKTSKCLYMVLVARKKYMSILNFFSFSYFNR
jgi:hypothetical protein